MRPLSSLSIYLAVVFLGGALMAPWLYFLTQTAASHFPVLESLAANRFPRFVSRSFLILALLGLWPFFRSLKLHTWSEVGFGPKRELKNALTGFCVGLASLGGLATLVILAGTRKINFEHSVPDYFKYLAKSISAAIIVAILEETIFRGGLFGALRKAHSWKIALVISSMIYALVHFLSRVPDPPSVHWLSGLVTLGQMLDGFRDWQMLIPGFFNLSLAGIILALGYHFSGTLYFSIGLHGGWIFWLKSYGFLTRSNSDQHSWFWGTAKLIDGWAAFIVLALTLLIVISCQRNLFRKINVETEKK